MLNVAGWDCSKNLLIIDEWRLCTHAYDMGTKPEIKERATSTVSMCLPIGGLAFDKVLDEIDTPDKDNYTIELPSQPRNSETMTAQKDKTV